MMLPILTLLSLALVMTVKEVEFDITLPMVKCSMLNIDSNDPAGQPQNLHLDRHHHIWKHRVKVVDGGRKDGGDGNGNNIKTASSGMRFELIGEKQKLEAGSTLLRDASVQEGLAELKKSDKTLHEIVSSSRQLEAGDGEDSDDEELCGSCYGAAEDDNECCNTCDDVKRAYSRKGWHITDLLSFKQCQKESTQKSEEGDDEGCNVHGIIALDSAGGSWHLAPGRSKDHSTTSGDISSSIFELLLNTFETFNVSHVTHKIR